MWRIRESITRLFDIINYKFFCPKLRVMHTDETLNFVLKNKIKVIRFGDGEFDYIGGNNLTYQKYKKEMAEQLSNVIKLRH